MAEIKFYRGEKSKYNQELHSNGIFFATDTTELLMGGKSYGGNIQDITFDSGSNALVVTKKDGSKSQIQINQFITEDLFKNGLVVSDNTVAVRLGDSSETKNFIEFEGDTDGQKALAVRKMDTNVTVTTKDIPVAGGPLAESVAEVYPDGIPEGTDLQSILMNLLCKEIYPNATVTTGKLTSSFAKPSVTIPNSGKSVEVGTSITVPQFVGYEPTKNAVARTYSGFTYGWSAADDDSKDADGNPGSVAVTSIALNTGTFTVKRTYTGFGKDSTPTTVSNAVAAQCIIAQDTTPVVAEGANKVRFDISGPGHKGTVVASPDYFIVSNLGNTDSTKKVAAQQQQDLSVATATAAYQEYTVTGYRNAFHGSKTSPIEINSANIRALTPTNGVKKAFNVTVVEGSKQVIISYPATWGELQKVADTGAFGTDIKGSFVKQTTQVEGANGYEAIEYNTYVYSPDAALGKNTYEITIA